MDPRGEPGSAPKGLTLLPSGCSLDDDDFQTRAGEWAALHARLRSVDRSSGDARIVLRFENGAGVADSIRGLAEAERRCCSGASFDVEESAEEVSLEVAGDGEVVAAFAGFGRGRPA